MLPLALILLFGVDKAMQGALNHQLAPTARAVPPATAPVNSPLSLVDFMGAQGCTFTPERDIATRVAGFDPYEIDRLITTSLANGTARMEGDYVVLSPSICTIRQPQIESRWSVDSPEVQAVAPYIREEFESGGEVEVTEGCFLNDPSTLFTELAVGDADVGNAAYIAFLGASIISGDARFYAPTPLATPRGFQVTTGDCARAPNVPAIVDNHLFVEGAFGDWVRAVGDDTQCGEDLSWQNLQIAVELQGVEIDALGDDTTTYNAWLGFEFQLIAMSAGWFDGMSATEKGTPRPPLCHYP